MIKRKVFCGIDPSLSSTGVCISALDDADFFSCTLKSKFFGAPRLIDLRDKLATVLSANPVDYVFYEGYAFGARGRVFDLGELGGVFKVFLCERVIPCHIVPPNTLKKFIIGKGAGAKDLMREYVYKHFGMGSDRLKTNDEVDAFALCNFGKAVYNHLSAIDIQLPAANKQAVYKFVKDTGMPEDYFSA